MTELIAKIGLNRADVQVSLLLCILLVLIYTINTIYNIWVSEKKDAEKSKSKLDIDLDPDFEYVDLYEEKPKYKSAPKSDVRNKDED